MFTSWFQHTATLGFSGSLARQVMLSGGGVGNYGHPTTAAPQAASMASMPSVGGGYYHSPYAFRGGGTYSQPHPHPTFYQAIIPPSQAVASGGASTGFVASRSVDYPGFSSAAGYAGGNVVASSGSSSAYTEPSLSIGRDASPARYRTVISLASSSAGESLPTGGTQQSSVALNDRGSRSLSGRIRNNSTTVSGSVGDGGGMRSSASEGSGTFVVSSISTRNANVDPALSDSGYRRSDLGASVSSGEFWLAIYFTKGDE